MKPLVLLVLGAALALTGCGGTTSDEDSSPTSTTLAAPRPPGQVRIFVLNGSGLTGAARNKADVLVFFGYALAGIGNAPPQVGTVVACRKGFQAESAELATAVGPGTTVAAFPKPEPEGVEGADCIIGLGT